MDSSFQLSNPEISSETKEMKADSGSSESSSDTVSDSWADDWKIERECSAVMCFSNKSWHCAVFWWVLQHTEYEYAKKRAPT